jgi:hypothetical protein
MEEATAVAKGVSDFGMVVVAAGFYLTITAVMMIVILKWFVKLVNGIINSQQAALKEILVLQKSQDAKIGQIKEAVTSEEFNKIRVMSDYAFDFNMFQVLLSIADIKERNNLKNRTRVEKDLHQVLNNLYERRNSDFDTFTYNGKKLSQYANHDWAERLYDLCIDAIYDGKDYQRAHYLGKLKQFYETVKIEFLDNLKKR